jgi:hypothetical protein
MSLIWFAVSVGMFCIYTATAYLPLILLRGRFDRERMFADLGDPGALDDDAYAALLRVGAEALTNAERHAHAHNVALTLTRDGCDLLLRVRDDGVGILATNPPSANATARDADAARMIAVGASTASASSASAGATVAPDSQRRPIDAGERIRRIGAGAPAMSDYEGALDVSIASPPGHYGITGMRERIAEVGGRFSIGPAGDDANGAHPTRGTVVEARVPRRGL